MSLLGSNWKITFEGDEFHESDLTLLGAAKALTVCGGSWADLHPLRSPDHFAAILAAFLTQSGEDFDEALARVGSMSIVAALNMIGVPDGPR